MKKDNCIADFLEELARNVYTTNPTWEITTDLDDGIGLKHQHKNLGRQKWWEFSKTIVFDQNRIITD